MTHTATEATPVARGVRLGLRENAAQFALLVLVNGFVGATLGAERSVLPQLAREAFGITSAAAALGFLVTFGLAKASANYGAGRFADRIGRRRLLITGWLFALPVPWILYWARSWDWVVAANALLGVNQGLAWSATVIMKIDLVGPRRRGLAMGLNEFAGYLAVAIAALGASYLAVSTGPRVALLVWGAGASAAGLIVTLVAVRDTSAHVAIERGLEASSTAPAAPSVTPSRWRLAGANQAGLVNNLNDGLAWGLLPLYFAAGGLSVRRVGWLAALYPAVWGVAQVGTGALSDRIGRRGLIVFGMLLQAGALALTALAGSFRAWAVAAVLLGLGTAAVYPTLIAQVSDLVSARQRARAVGSYRLWRDLGYVAGAVIAGTAADRIGYRSAILAVAALTAASGLVAGVLLRPQQGSTHVKS